MEKNIERIQQIMKLYYDKQEENNELTNKNLLERKDLSEKLLNIKETKKNERENLNKQLEQLEQKKEEEIKEKICKYREQYFPNNLKDTIESEYKKRKDAIEYEIKTLTLTLKELKGITKTEENKTLLSSQIKEINKKIKSLKNELDNLEVNKNRELETTIPSVIYGVFENIIKSELEPLYNEKEQELNSKISELCNETEEEISIKKVLESMPDYSNVYNREMAYLKDKLARVLYSEIKIIEYMITIVSNERKNIFEKIKERNSFLIHYQAKQSQIMQDLANFKYEYDDDGNVTNASVWDNLSKSLRSVSDKIRLLQSESSNNTDNIDSYDNQLADLRNDLNIANESRLILEYTEAESKSVLRALSSTEMKKYDERNYETKIELKIKLLNDELENENRIKNKATKTQEFSKINGHTFVELKSPDFDTAKTQEFSANFDGQQNLLSSTAVETDLSVTDNNVDDKTDMTPHQENNIDFIIEEIDAKKINDLFKNYENCSELGNKSKFQTKNPNGRKLFELLESFSNSTQTNDDDVIVIK